MDEADRYDKARAFFYLTGQLSPDDVVANEQLDQWTTPGDEELDKMWAVYTAMYNPKDPRPHPVQAFGMPERKLQALYKKLFPPAPEPPRDEDDEDEEW